ncbi:MAG: hypothetical protein WA990_06330 [Rubrobacteraceae bacterium]
MSETPYSTPYPDTNASPKEDAGQGGRMPQEGWREFAPYLKAQARGPANLGELGSDLSEAAMDLILRGVATPAQIAGFLLVGRARTETSRELAAYARAMRNFVREIEPPPGAPVVTVAGSFDGKIRTFNVGVAASLAAAAAGGRILMLGGEGVPPKFGRTAFDIIRGFEMPVPETLDEAEGSLGEQGFTAISPKQYLPELHGLLQLRREMVRRTALNVVEKMVTPVPGSPIMIGVTHRPFLETIPKALTALGIDRALVYQAIEGSDEAVLDGNSSLVLVRDGMREEFRVDPQRLGLSRATRAHIPWNGPEDEARRLGGALDGEEGPVRDLILYNAALRLWMGDDGASLEEHLRNARRTMESGLASNASRGAVPAVR